MSVEKYLFKRNGTQNFEVRVTVPKDLRHFYKATKRTRTTGESNPKKALDRSHAIIAEIKAEFDALRQTGEMTKAHVEHARWEHYVSSLEKEEQFRLLRLTDAEMDELYGHVLKEMKGDHEAAYEEMRFIEDLLANPREHRERYLAMLKRAAATGDTNLMRDQARAAIRALGVQPDETSPEFSTLAAHLVRSEIEVQKRLKEQDEGEFGGKPSDPVVVRPKSALPKAVPENMTMMKLYERFQREASGRATEDTWNANKYIVSLFAEWWGENRHIEELKKTHVRDWKEQLTRWPDRAAQRDVFKGLKFKDVIEKNKTAGVPTISDKTINNYLSALGAFGKWLRANDFIVDNITEGQYLDINNESIIKPFSSESLISLFNSKEFTTLSEKRGWRFFFPLVAIYTGARLGEIAQLHTADIKTAYGIDFFHITTLDSNEKKVKTKGSERVVPIHPELVRLGLMDYIAHRRSSGEKMLWEDQRKNARDQWSGMPSDFYQRLLKKVGVKTDKTHNFHSFRHNAADAMRLGGYLDEQFNIILGHTKATATQRYGIVTEGNIRSRKDMIESMVYPDLDLKHLYIVAPE